MPYQFTYVRTKLANAHAFRGLAYFDSLEALMLCLNKWNSAKPQAWSYSLDERDIRNICTHRAAGKWRPVSQNLDLADPLRRDCFDDKGFHYYIILDEPEKGDLTESATELKAFIDAHAHPFTG